MGDVKSLSEIAAKNLEYFLKAEKTQGSKTQIEIALEVVEQLNTTDITNFIYSIIDSKEEDSEEDSEEVKAKELLENLISLGLEPDKETNIKTNQASNAISECGITNKQQKEYLINASIVNLTLMALAGKYPSEKEAEPQYELSQDEKTLTSYELITELLSYLKIETGGEDHESINNQILHLQKKVETIQVENKKEADIVKAKKEAEAKRTQIIEHITAILTSTITGTLAGIYSQALQNALFGKILFGKAILFGYTLPVVNLAVASIAFGLVALIATFSVIFIAKLAQKKPLFKEQLEVISHIQSAKTLLWATLVGIIFTVFNTYALPIQVIFFGKVLLGGTLLTNASFALIATTFMGATAYIASHSQKNFKQLSPLFAFILGTWFATPIMQSLFGIVISGGPWAVVASSIGVGLASAFLTLVFLLIAIKVIRDKHGFALTMFVSSFVALSIYASPIQIAILGHTVIFITPMLSHISFGAILSLITAPILDKLYWTAETNIDHIIINPSEAFEYCTDKMSHAFRYVAEEMNSNNIFSPASKKEGHNT